MEVGILVNLYTHLIAHIKILYFYNQRIVNYWILLEFAIIINAQLFNLLSSRYANYSRVKYLIVQYSFFIFKVTLQNNFNIYEKYRFTLGTKCMPLYTIVEESTRTSKRCAMFVFASLSAHCNSYETFKKLSFLLHFTDRVTGTSVQEYIL
jgi:hypothetical protein